jgi:hypothetical protein
MSNVRDPKTDQPLPIPNDQPSIHMERKALCILSAALLRLVYVKDVIKPRRPDIYPDRRDYAWKCAREALEECGISWVDPDDAESIE